MNELPRSIQESRAEVAQRQISRLVSFFCEASVTDDQDRLAEMVKSVSKILIEDLTCNQFNMIGGIVTSLRNSLVEASYVRAVMSASGMHDHENCKAEFETYKDIAELNGEEL